MLGQLGAVIGQQLRLAGNVQGAGKWFEGAARQAVYWSVSNDTGLTWGPTQVMIAATDTLPLWGPVLYSTVHLTILHVLLHRGTYMRQFLAMG